MKKNIRFYGNLYNCPAGKRKPDCPITDLKNLTFAEKVDWFDNLAPEDQKTIEEHHNSCIEKRNSTLR